MVGRYLECYEKRLRALCSINLSIVVAGAAAGCCMFAGGSGLEPGQFGGSCRFGFGVVTTTTGSSPSGERGDGPVTYSQEKTTYNVGTR